MKIGSVCSGIEAASTAWHPLGWTTAYVAEIEPFPCAVLAQRIGAGRPAHLPDGADPRPFTKIEWGDRVPNFGDFTRITANPPAVDVLVGGTPCQAFSFAGNRESLGDARGNLTLEFVRLVHATQDLQYAVWENVPGVLSTDDNAFGCFLAGLVGGNDPLHVPGDGRWPDSGMVDGPLGRAAWRILDAQHFGVAQRRRRVFLVFCPRGSRGDPAAILFERQGVPRDFEAGGEAWEGIAGGALEGADRGVAPTLSARTKGGGGLGTDFDLDGGLIESAIGSGVSVAAIGCNRHSGAINVAACLNAKSTQRQDFETETLIVAHAFDARQQDCVQYGDLSGPLDTDGESVGVLSPQACSHHEICGNCDRDLDECRADPCTMVYPVCCKCLVELIDDPPAPPLASQVRRLTPRECERLQAFPDDYTRIRIRHFAKRTITKNRPVDMWEPAEDGGWWLMAADGPRYKALGNSMACVCMSWIGQRIAAFKAGTLDGWHFDWSLIPWVLRPSAAQQCGVIPILEAGARTGTSTTDARAGLGVGKVGDPMFTLWAGKQHAVSA